MKTIWLVVPCYNEEEVLPETSKQLKNVMSSMIENGKISPESKIAFVNDGSKDNTWNIISTLCTGDGIFAGINLSRNKGHQNALLAGLMTAKKYADAVISLDADLQDDVNAIEKMVDNFIAGDDIVYGVRSSRKTDTFFKRFTAEGFYKFMAAMGVEIVFNHADYRLMSRRALDALSEFDEVNLFLRGIVPQIGFKTSTVEYERKERLAGESKYPLKKMLSFAFEGITSFSVRPLSRLHDTMADKADKPTAATTVYRYPFIFNSYTSVSAKPYRTDDTTFAPQPPHRHNPRLLAPHPPHRIRRYGVPTRPRG